MTPPVRLNRLGWYLCAGGRILRSRLTGARPFFISHLVTRRCFARCPTCLWRGEGPEEKDTGRIVDFYRRAAREGFFSTTFWGGEPLLREDLPEILRASREAGLVTGLITNGYLLPRRYREIGNQLDFLIVSLDIPSAAHDRLRGVEGLFAAAREGVALVREANPRLRVMINTVASVYAAEHAYWGVSACGNSVSSPAPAGDAWTPG